GRRHHPMCPLSFFDAPATPEPSTLSLHDALPIFVGLLKPAQAAEDTMRELGTSSEEVRMKIREEGLLAALQDLKARVGDNDAAIDRKSTRLNSSHVKISYAVFCLKKKKPQRPNRV